MIHQCEMRAELAHDRILGFRGISSFWNNHARLYVQYRLAVAGRNAEHVGRLLDRSPAK